MDPDGAASGGADGSFVAVKDRLAKAKQDQQQKEAEKLEKIRINRSNNNVVVDGIT